jgi:hypothetical protein
MLEKFIYEDHLGRRFVGLDCGVYMNYNDLRDYSWSYETINSRISRFYRGITTRKIPLVVYCGSDEEAMVVMNRLHELAETDVAANQPGKIYIGDYYTHGYITGSTKANYLVTKRLCEITLTFVSDDPAWYRDQLHTFPAGTDNQINSESGTDYPYAYPYDYALRRQGWNIVSDTIGSSAFRLEIFGVAEDPAITIGGHVYKVRGKVSAGEVLTIDSIAKTVTLSTVSGQKINWFDNRNRESYVFEPIPAGKNSVTWSGEFGFNLTLIEKRSEPKWT